MSLNFPVIDPEATSIFEAPNLTGTPERRLLLAILERALLDYVGNDSEEAKESEGWIFDLEDNEDESFSFSWICKELDLHIPDIREKIRLMPKRGASRIAPWYLTKNYGKPKSDRSSANSATANNKQGKVIKFAANNSRLLNYK